VALPNPRYVKRKPSVKAAGSDCGHLAAPLFGPAVTHENAFLNITKHTERITTVDLIAFVGFLVEIMLNLGKGTRNVTKKKTFIIIAYVLKH
jgi:hypothetical protein